MQQVLCPQCGAPVKFTSTASVMAVCGACRSTLLKDAESVKRIGEMADVLEDYSPLCLGATGKFDSKRFDVIGRIQLRFDEGFWNEWYVWFEDGSDGWLSDASGQYAVTRRRKVKSLQGMPAFTDISPGDELKLDGQRFVAADVRTAQAGGAQGELPFVPGDGWEAKVADYRSLDAFLTLDFSDAPEPELYIGKAFDLSAMQAGSLRTNEQVEETAGRFRGQIKALECPNCGAPISFVAAMATHVVCPSCASAVDCSGPTAEVIEKGRKVKAITTTLSLGAVAKIDGASFTLIGLMKCADPDPDEPSDWIEYLLFNPAKGFIWLVETDEGWERVQVCDTWPSLNNATSVRWRSKLYQKLYDYTSRVEMPLGAFNWRVKAGDTTKITDYKAGTLKLTRELAANELGWSASAPIAPAQLAEWFGDAQLAKQKSLPLAGKRGGYAKWAWTATIGMVFLNMSNILNGRFIAVLIGLAFLWFPAKLADKFSGKDE
jgi:ribosomal protein S27AE